MCCEGDVHWWGNTAPQCSYKADGKRCLLLHVLQHHLRPAFTRKWWHLVVQNPSFFITMQEVTPLLLSWSSCTTGNGRFWNSTILSRYESMRFRSLHQSERTTARDLCNTRDELMLAIGWSIRNIIKEWHADWIKGWLYWRYINVVPLWIKMSNIDPLPLLFIQPF